MKKYYLAVIFFLVAKSIHAQLGYQKHFSIETYTIINYVVLNTDGSYAMLGETHSSISLQPVYMFLTKCDDHGNILWTNKYSSAHNSYPLDLTKTYNDGYLITSSIFGSSTSLGTINYIKTDSSGNIEWSKVFSGFLLGKTLQCPDSGFLSICSANDSLMSVKYDFFLFKLSHDGDTVWTRRYGLLNGSQVTDDAGDVLQLMPDGGCIIGGKNYHNLSSGIYLMRVDSLGNVLWSYIYKTTIAQQYAKDIVQAVDGGFIVCGKFVIDSTGIEDFFVMKIDPDGKVIWSKSYNCPGTYQPYDQKIIKCNDGYLISSMIEDLQTFSQSGALIKINVQGIVQWSRIYDPNPPDGYHMSNAAATNDNGALLVGGSNHEGYVVKTDSTGDSGCFQPLNFFSENPVVFDTLSVTPVISSGTTVIPETFTMQSAQIIMQNICMTSGINDKYGHTNNLSVYPNPFSTFTTIKIDSINLSDKIKTLSVHDTYGREIKQVTFSGNEFVLRKDKLASGLYFIMIEYNNSIISSGKIIVE